MLLRPKTGLKDMVVELEPGHARARAAWRTAASSRSARRCPTSTSTRSWPSLDGDTRDYLTVLLGAGAEGLRGNGARARATRSAASSRPPATAAKVFGALAKRRQNIKRVIHNFSLVMDELGAKDDQLAEFVENSNAVFATLARQDANLRATLRELPLALDETQRGLGKAKTLADELGPTLQALRPGARALGPTLRQVRPFLRETTPIIRDEIRPFVRASRPTVARAAAGDARPRRRRRPTSTSTFKVVNYLLDALAYNPPGKEEGYLFWVAWANHLGNPLFATQDAHGPIRRGLFVASCQDVPVLDQVAQANPLLGTLTDLLNLPKQNCPQTPTPGPRPGGG